MQTLEKIPFSKQRTKITSYNGKYYYKRRSSMGCEHFFNMAIEHEFYDHERSFLREKRLYLVAGTEVISRTASI